MIFDEVCQQMVTSTIIEESNTILQMNLLNKFYSFCIQNGKEGIPLSKCDEFIKSLDDNIKDKIKSFDSFSALASDDYIVHFRSRLLSSQKEMSLNIKNCIKK